MDACKQTGIIKIQLSNEDFQQKIPVLNSEDFIRLLKNNLTLIYAIRMIYW